MAVQASAIIYVMHAYENHMQLPQPDGRSFKTINLSSDEILAYILYFVELVVSIQNLRQVHSNDNELEKGLAQTRLFAAIKS